MRALLVHTSPLHLRGGAEISFRQHLEHAPAEIEVKVVHPAAKVDLNAYDVVILGNLRPTAPPPAERGGTLRQWLWDHINDSPFQRLALRSEVAWARLWCRQLIGYRGYVIKSERDIHPCSTRDARCLHNDPLRIVPCGATRVVTEAFERLYNLCDAVQFLSPLHRRAINLMLRIDVRQYEIAAPVDTDLFRDYTPHERRKHAALLTGDAIREAPTAEQRARGAGYPIERLKYLSAPYEKMPEILNQYRAVVVDPVMLHAFGRLAVEALACGCNVLASDRVGAMSWPDPLQAGRDANRRFWEMVTDVPARPNPRRLRGRAHHVQTRASCSEVRP